jgi:superfamily II DNA or RNA helicase
MISKLCAFGPRSEFIVSLVRDLFTEYPEKQVMILGHNRNLLTYLYDSISHKGFASCGYYLGGMKQKDLQVSETKQVVIATYAMAAEALDIKTLSTLVMVTPKTDITQSIGRILRVKGNNPIVVDIVDAHTNFVNQWNQRKRFYKKNGYLINSISSDNYIDMVSSKWKCVYDPEKDEKNKKSDKDEEEGVYGGKCLIQW